MVGGEPPPQVRTRPPAHPGGLFMHIPKPWYRASKDAWFVEIHGRQHRLGKHPEGAPPPKKGKTGWNPPDEILRIFHELMVREDPGSLPMPARLTVAELFNRFLDDI